MKLSLLEASLIHERYDTFKNSSDHHNNTFTDLINNYKANETNNKSQNKEDKVQ